MQKHLLYINLFAITSALALGACADEVENAVAPVVPEEGEKTPIELAVGSAETPSTRAVIIDGKGKVTAFENDTRLHLLMVSENADNDADKKFTVTYGLAVGSGTPPKDLTTNTTVSEVSFDQTIKIVNQTHKETTPEGTVVVEGYRNPANETIDKNPVENNSKNGIVRYWDDAHARKSKLSIYGFCINGTVLPFGAPWNQKIDGIASNSQNIEENKAWKTGSPTSYKIGAEDVSHNLMKWKIGDHSVSYNAQTFLSVLYKDDICYSNNIVGGAVLQFNNKQSGKFDSGVIEFHRAVSLITILIQPGQGFTSPFDTDFKFAAGKNIQMQGFNKEGYLSIADGTWSEVASGSWTSICNATAPNDTYYTLMAFVIPGNDLNADADAASKTAMVFTIDGNEYKLSKQDLLNALKGNPENLESGGSTIKTDYMTDGTKLKAGINYQFTLAVGKSAIDKISATVVDWKTVPATAAPDNAHPLTVSMETTTATLTPIASYLYKSAVNSATVDGNEKGYSNSDRFALAENTDAQNTGWYWPNNSTYYHFRTIAPKEDLTVAGDENDNYITMTGGVIANSNDYVWGAPLVEKHGESPENHNIPYDWEKGYEDYLYSAIGATKSNIHITQFHMMSDIEINLKTTSEEDAVTLTDYVTVALKSYANTANLMVGTGLVTNQGSIQNSRDITQKSDATTGFAKTFTWRVVPQALSRSAGATVGLCITSTDSNVYDIPDLSTLPVTVNSNSTTIPKWEPGKKYIYNLTLKKTGIENITATVVDWETVTADYDNVQIR